MLYQTKLRILAGLLLVNLALQLTAQEIKIRIAATSDIHGCIFPYDFEENRAGKSSLAGVAFLVDSIRRIKHDNLVLLDDGDMVQGTPVSYYANFVQSEKENLFARVMNYMSYDAATVGNHDIEAGPAVYNLLKKEFRFPYLGANVVDNQTGSSWFQPYCMVERAGIRLAVIGLTTTGVPRWLPRQLWLGLSFEDMVQSAEIQIKTVREKEHPDMVIGLFHSGYGDLSNASDMPMEDAGRYIAVNVPGFDVIILGHDHRSREEVITNKEGKEVLVLNPGTAALNLAYAELIFHVNDQGKPELTGKKGQLLKVPVSAVSAGMMRHFRKDREEIMAFSNRPVGKIDAPMRSADALFGNSPLTDLIHNVQLEITGADVSFTAPLSVTGMIKPGTLYVRDLFKMYRYENFLYTMKLTGSEIQRYLEYSCGLWFNRMASDNDHLLLFRKGESARLSLQNPPYNFDSAAGIRYTVDVTQPVGKRVHITGMGNGEPFDPAKTYKVAVNSYRGSGGGGHLTSGAGIDPEKLPERIISSSSTDFRTLLMKYFQSHQIIHPSPADNWKIIPVNVYEKGKNRDMVYFEK